MSAWGSRFGDWASGRWSPFGARSASPTTVTDSDFSYITTDGDEQPPHRFHHQENHDSHHQHAHHSSSLRNERPAKDTDALQFRHNKVTYTVHFEAYSIDDGDLTVGMIRKGIARRLDVVDPRRVSMFCRGRNLKEDSRLCRDEGLRSDGSPEILCVVGDVRRDPQDAEDASEDDEESGSELTPAGSRAESSTAKKKRRPRKKKPKKSAGYEESSTPTVEHLPVPSGTHPLHRPSSIEAGQRGPTPSPRGSRGQSPAPQTPLEKLDAIASNFRTNLVPQCMLFINSPPTDKAKRNFEHKKLSETIMGQILLELDGVQTEGDEDARSKRKELVKEVQAMLTRLDEVVKA